MRLKSKPNLLHGVFVLGAVVGVVATAYFSAKNGQKITEATDEIVEKVKAEEDKPAKIKAVVKSVPGFAKVAWQPLVCMGATYACMIATHKINAKQIAALTATCAYVTRNRNYLEQKLKEYVGEEELAKIKKGFVAKEIVREKIVYGGPTVEVSAFCREEDDPGVLCFEGFSGRWFRCPKDHIEEAQKQLQKMFEDDIYCCYNDYFGFLGITMTQFGHEWGWVNHDDHYSEIHFTNTMLTPEEWDDFGPDGGHVGENVYVLETDVWPMEAWMEI